MNGITQDVTGNALFHATAPGNLESILDVGFKLPFYSEPDYGEFARLEGCIGHGVYTSRDWRMSLWFNHALLRVELVKGTRILDVSGPADVRVLDSLKREFGRDILSEKAVIHKLLPRNKHLKLSELVELTRYHYTRSFGSPPPTRRPHHRSLRQCFSLLRRYKYDGFGHPTSDIGLMLLSPDRLRVVELVAVLEDRDYTPTHDPKCGSLEELRAHFRKHGRKEDLEIARTIAAAHT